MNTIEYAYTTQELQVIAGTIRQQIGAWPCMEVGGRGYTAGNFKLIGEDRMPGLWFIAKPKSRLVDVYVLLAPSDTYTVIVRKRNVHTPTTLYRAEGVYADSLTDIIRNLPNTI